MTLFDDNPFDALDDELRRVPLPLGLIERLRRIARADDVQLDAALRAVPLPDGLLPRLREVVVCSDAYIDQRLSESAVPSGLLQRLGSIPQYGDQELIAHLVDVPMPETLLERLSGIPEAERAEVFSRRRRRAGHWWQLATAASLVFMISSSYLLAIASFVSSAYYREAEPVRAVSVDQAPLQLQLRNEVEIELADAAITQSPVDADAFCQAVVEWDGDERFFVTSDMLVRGPVDDLSQWLGTSSDPGRLSDPAQSTIMQIPLASDRTHAVQPPRRVANIATRGVTPHWADPQALLFQYKHGVHPFLNPAKADSMRFSRVPLITSIDSYEYAWDRLLTAEAGAIDEKELKKALADKIRVEEFIQSQNYMETPPAPGTLGIRAHGGPSPFGSDGSRLLQVIVQAGDLPSLLKRPTHMTVLVDPDIAGHGTMPLASVQRALHVLVDQLSPQDTLALVTAGAEAHLLIEASGPRRASALHRAIDLLRIQDTFNVAEGLRLAATIADSSDSSDTDSSRVLVLLSDGVHGLASTTEGRIERLFGELAGSGVSPRVIHLRSGRMQNETLDRFAEAGSGRVIAVGEERELDWALSECFRGQSNVIATDAQLTVRFNPDAVVEYRLIGHEATSVLGVVEAPLEGTLRAGQASVGMFEVRFHDRGPNVVGWAELSWLDPRSGRSNHLRQPISRLQFAGTFAEAALSLQAASIATEVAELLRESPFAERPASSFEKLQRLARQVDRPLRERPEFQRLLQFLDRAVSMGIR